MATARDPSRVREAKPYGPALDCSLAVAKTSTRLNKANGLKSLARKGTFLLGYRGGHFYWATTAGSQGACGTGTTSFTVVGFAFRAMRWN